MKEGGEGEHDQNTHTLVENRKMKPTNNCLKGRGIRK
jgi:hypothetical protein